MKRWLLALLLVAGCRGCKGCTPGLDDTQDDSADSAEDTEDSGPIDTAPEPPCTQPEIEPNGTAETANPIGLEVQGCGDVSQPLDLDHWAFTTEETGWIGIYVDSTSVGSSADVMLWLEGGGDSVEIKDREGAMDVRLVFEAPADDWVAMVTDQWGLGGPDDFYYDFLVTSVKEPVSWTEEEVEDNGSSALAPEVSSGDRILGIVGETTDFDWYKVRVPAGAHTVTFDIDAYSYGSAGDFKLVLYDGSLNSYGTWRFGEQGWELDPVASIQSPGDGTIYVQVIEESDPIRSGIASWYVLDVDLKGA